MNELYQSDCQEKKFCGDILIFREFYVSFGATLACILLCVWPLELCICSNIYVVAGQPYAHVFALAIEKALKASLVNIYLDQDHKIYVSMLLIGIIRMNLYSLCFFCWKHIICAANVATFSFST